MFPKDDKFSASRAASGDDPSYNSNTPQSNTSPSPSPSNSPRAKSHKPKGKPKSVKQNAQLQHVVAPTDERNVWVYEPALKSIELAAASREAAAARADALSLKLLDGSVGDEDSTLITVRLPDRQSATFKMMRSTPLNQVHAAAAAAFDIESEFFFSMTYPRKLLLQQTLSLDELGLVPQGLLLVVFSDEADTVRKSGYHTSLTAKVALGNILEMELKEQQIITKSVHSHVIARHPKVANLIRDASSAKHNAAPAAAAHVGGDEISAALTAVDGLFLKTNVELQTISNSSRSELPIEAMKKMVRIEAAQEQRVIDRELEKQQYHEHVKRLDLISAGLLPSFRLFVFGVTACPAGASRSAVHRASSALLYKREPPSDRSEATFAKKSSNAAQTTSANVSPRRKLGAAASSTRPSSSSAIRPILGFDHYRSSMETVDDILRKSSGISREKYIETLVGCIDARHAAKTEPKLLSR